ncbi:hypothetical protein H0A36_17920 [Endozoicomonas sp. SM1973]|uniref:Uncharacterized protein n=1 Tax=Spartinivicinus marinus TaxID=2994442 RepID=A0A853IJS3_9GAMM|nr:hypothetical protein [Spartinivicinus marinus]MCX4025996.1 hypothetical protein [Spartinivicinus marinus]NYZ67896.1 hypothetical protein [Spartinivicinus marinus]
MVCVSFDFEKVFQDQVYTFKASDERKHQVQQLTEKLKQEIFDLEQRIEQIVTADSCCRESMIRTFRTMVKTRKQLLKQLIEK